MRYINILAVTVILLLPLTTGAVPQYLNHQGYMAINNGDPLTGSSNVVFNIYTDETGGSSIWTQTIDVTFDGGYYSLILGPGTPELSVALFDGSDLYIGITLEGENEFVPRMRIASMPYAFLTEAVDGEVNAMGGLTVDGVQVIDSAQK